jgi:hypothetical protein
VLLNADVASLADCALAAEGRHEEAEPVLWEVLDMLETACKVELEKAGSATWPAVVRVRSHSAHSTQYASCRACSHFVSQRTLPLHTLHFERH